MTLPTVGGNAGTHGTVLNAHINVGHDADGTHKKSAMLTDMGWSPTAYVGGETITFPNGLIMKMGYVVSGDTDVSFGTAFPIAVVSIQITPVRGTHCYAVVTSVTLAGFDIVPSSATAIYWLAIGY